MNNFLGKKKRTDIRTAAFAPYDPTLGPVDRYLDDDAFRLLGLPLPAWYINSDHKRPFWDTIATKFPLQTASGLDTVLSANTPPSLDFFQTLPTSKPKTWGVYAITLIKPLSTPKLYIGSCTSVDGT